MWPNRTKLRTSRGSTMAEMPAAMWLLLIGLTMPMIDLAAIGLKSTFVVSAVHDAAHSAARSKSFVIPVDQDYPSALKSARDEVSQYSRAFSGISIQSVAVNIVITNVSDGTTTRHSTALTQPPDTNANTYSLEVVVSASVDPLISCDLSWLPAIPGLSAPLPLTYATQEFSEFPQGLTQ